MQSKIKNIILVGPMGSGKTTIGRRLSEKLSLDFFDSDHEIIDTTGVSIDHIFDVEGEEGISELAWTSPLTKYIIEAYSAC